VSLSTKSTPPSQLHLLFNVKSTRIGSGSLSIFRGRRAGPGGGGAWVRVGRYL
jgi:hypothetical protein